MILLLYVTDCVFLYLTSSAYRSPLADNEGMGDLQIAPTAGCKILVLICQWLMTSAYRSPLADNEGLGDLQIAPTAGYKTLVLICQWLMINDLCSLFTFHSSLFTLHSPLPSYMLNLLFSASKCCNFATFLMSISSRFLLIDH